MSTEKSYLISNIEQLGISLSDGQADRFLLYYDLLTEGNRVMNLTSVTEFVEVVRTHFTDSLSLFRVMDPRECGRILDVGSGAGFPGIPLAILCPESRIVLLDSLGKRVRFLTDAAARLGLPHVEAIHGRAEDLARQKEHRERYDLVVSRAVANLSVLSEYCLPYVNQNGLFAAYKSDKSGDEIAASEKAVSLLGGVIEKQESFRLNDTGRTIVLIRKTKKTPAAYPRKAGLPGKSPLS